MNGHRTVTGPSTDNEAEALQQSTRERLRVTFPLRVGGDRLPAAYKASRFPGAIVVGRDGLITSVGLAPGYAGVRELVHRVGLAELPPPESLPRG